MRRTSVVVMAVAALALVGAEASAQAKSFAGSWALVVDPNAPPPTGRGGGGGRGGLGQAATITQDDKTLTITRATQAGEMKTVYNLDGSESKNTMAMQGNSVEQVSKAKWDGGRLVITTSMTFNGQARESSMALSLDDGGHLVVEATSPGRGGGEPTTTKLTYNKKA